MLDEVEIEVMSRIILGMASIITGVLRCGKGVRQRWQCEKDYCKGCC